MRAVHSVALFVAFASTACLDVSDASLGDNDAGGTGGTSSVQGDDDTGGTGDTAATSGGNEPGGAPDTGRNVTPCVADNQIVITDDTNYSFSSTLTIQSTVVRDAENLQFDWSGVTVDFFGAPVDPATDIDMILISLWGMTQGELAANLNRDNLPLSANQGAITFYPDGTQTSAQLLDFDSFHTPIPEEDLWARFDTSTPGYQYPPESHTFMVMASTGTIPGKHSRMLGFFRLDPNSTNTTVALTNDSTQMQWSVDLAHAPQLGVPAGDPDLNIDWSQMTRNALGNQYDVTQITEAVVAHYADMTITDLEEQFLFLQDRADEWYSGDVVAGTDMDLSELADEEGNSFAGIDSNGVWLVALFCTNGCNNPAPWSITLLTPC